MSIEVSRRKVLQLAMAPALLLPRQMQDLAPTASKVYPGSDGKLVYVPDEQGNTILDSSHAGYGGGGVPVPTVPVKDTIWPVAGDNTENVQASIDRVSALPLDKNGFRGAVLLRAGYYRMATPINIRASGVVLRGEGMGDTGTILIGTGTGRPAAPPSGVAATGAEGRGGAGGRAGGPGGGFGGGQPTLIRIAGASGVTMKDETKQVVTDEYVPVGARKFNVASARGFKAGDTVIVRRIGNADWVAAVGMNGDSPQSRWQPFNIDWDRMVTFYVFPKDLLAIEVGAPIDENLLLRPGIEEIAAPGQISEDSPLELRLSSLCHGRHREDRRFEVVSDELSRPEPAV